MNQTVQSLREFEKFQANGLIEALEPARKSMQSADWAKVEKAVETALSDFREGAEHVVVTLRELSESDRKKAAKAQAHWATLKLAHTRKASAMSIEHQAIRLDVAHKEQMEAVRREAMLAAGAETAGSITKLEAELQKTTLEASRARESLKRALGELGITVDQNRTLEQTVAELAGVTSNLRSERDRLSTALAAANERVTGLQEEAIGLGDIQSASEQRTAELARELLSCKEALRSTLSQLDITVDENRSLGDQIEGLMMQAVNAKTEADRRGAQLTVEAQRAKETLHSTLAELGIKVDECLSLREQINQLAVQARSAQSIVKSARAEATALKVQLDEARSDLDGANERVREHERKAAQWAAEQANQDTDLKIAHDMLADLRIKHDMVVADLKTAKAALERASEELKLANYRCLKIQERNKQERSVLVQAAVSSLQQLRVHLVETLSGLRTKTELGLAEDENVPTTKSEPGLDGFAWNPKKHRWGVSTSPGAKKGKFDTMVVRLEVPGVGVSELLPHNTITDTSSSPRKPPSKGMNLAPRPVSISSSFDAPVSPSPPSAPRPQSTLHGDSPRSPAARRPQSARAAVMRGLPSQRVPSHQYPSSPIPVQVVQVVGRHRQGDTGPRAILPTVSSPATPSSPAAMMVPPPGTPSSPPVRSKLFAEGTTMSMLESALATNALDGVVPSYAKVASPSHSPSSPRDSVHEVAPWQ